MDTGAQQIKQAEAPAGPLPTRVITYAWGEKYLDELLTLTLPAALAPNNLPYVASTTRCELVILTEEKFFPKILSHPVTVHAMKICPVRLIGIDDLITQPDQYGMALTYVLHRGFADLGPAMTDTWLIFFNADFIVADGSWKNLLAHLSRGERIVASPSYCVVSEAVIPRLQDYSDGQTLPIPPRTMAALILQYRHTTIRGKTGNQPVFSNRYMDQFYWDVDSDTLIGHQMPVAIVGMRPERFLSEPTAFWDYGIIREYCPNAEFCVLGDSDEFLMLELRGGFVALDQIEFGPPNTKTAGELMSTWVTPYQRDFARFELILHSNDVPPGIGEARKRLAAFRDEILSCSPKELSGHVGHSQWNYHWPRFMQHRHEYLAARPDLITESTPAPATLTEIDRVWWQINVLKRRKRRQRSEIADSIDQAIQTINDIQKGVGSSQSVEHKEAARLLTELIASSPTAQAKLTNYRSIYRNDVFSTGLPDTSSPSPWLAIVTHYFENGGGQRDFLVDKREPLWVAKAIKTARDEKLQRLNAALNEDLEGLYAEYSKLLGTEKKMPASNIPIAATSEAPVDQPDILIRNGPYIVGPRRQHFVGRLRSILQRIFGELPRVTCLHPYYAPLQPMVGIVDATASSRPTDILFIGPTAGITHNIASPHSGRHLFILPQTLTPKTFAVGDPGFELCICELNGIELLELGKIVNMVLPSMKPGGRIVAVLLGTDLSVIPDNLMQTARSLADAYPSAVVHYAGSIWSHYAWRARSSVVSNLLQRRLKNLLLASFRMPVALILTAMANRRPSSLMPYPCSSITIDIKIPGQ